MAVQRVAGLAMAMAMAMAGCGGAPAGEGTSSNTSDASSTSNSATTTSAAPPASTTTSMTVSSGSTGTGGSQGSTNSVTTSTGGAAATSSGGVSSTGSSDSGGASNLSTNNISSSTGQAGFGGGPGEEPCSVAPLTAEFRQAYDNLDPFYQKYADANGIPVVSSASPADAALTRVCELVIDMTSARPDALAALIRNYVRIAVIGEDELTNDIPEHAYLDDSINERARGLGGVPATSCAEESILCNTELDRWRGEGICVHEFAHTLSMGGLFPADPSFSDRLQAAFDSAKANGLFANTYAMESVQEYWAEGVQDWYYTNLEAEPPNGIHNFVDRREELFEYDRALYDLIAEALPDEPQFVDCYSDE